MDPTTLRLMGPVFLNQVTANYCTTTSLGRGAESVALAVPVNQV